MVLCILVGYNKMELFKAGLKTVIIKSREPNNKQGQENEGSQGEFFTIFYCGWKTDKQSDPSYKYIPQFFPICREGSDHPLQTILKEESKWLSIERKKLKLFTNDELQTLALLLEKYQSPPFALDEQLINYTDFKKALSKASPKCKFVITPVVFAHLLQDDVRFRVGVMQLMDYALRKTWILQSRTSLSLYDTSGKGFLREADMENYMTELIPTLPQLDQLEKSFYRFYVCTAVRKFFFFLDPMRTGRIRIRDILSSDFLDSLLELRGENVPKSDIDNNWFSAANALRVYGQYLALDKNHNGMLNKEELMSLGFGTLTNVFIDRVFQTCLTYDGEMDYKSYLDFVLALENLQEPQSLLYLFRILDINNAGFLDAFTLHYFFKAVQNQMSLTDLTSVNFRNVQNEMFDMIKPTNPDKITLQDIIDSGHGDSLMTMLIDHNGYWYHDLKKARVTAGPYDQ